MSGHYSRVSSEPLLPLTVSGRRVWHQTAPYAMHSLVFSGGAWLVCRTEDLARLHASSSSGGGAEARMADLTSCAKAKLICESVSPSQGGDSQGAWQRVGADGSICGPLHSLTCLEAAPLPSAAEIGSGVGLFDDGFTHTCLDERTCRPGRGEGVADDVGELRLFDDVSPVAVKQGALGNCWLISVFSVLAERRASISNLCEQSVLSLDGRYTIHLFHPVRERWEALEVDDRLPVTKDGCALRYAGLTSSRELWVCLLEKAFARLFGSWAKLQGNSPALALKAMTGCVGEKLLVLRRHAQGDEW
jgi:hypothetical protein